MQITLSVTQTSVREGPSQRKLGLPGGEGISCPSVPWIISDMVLLWGKVACHSPGDMRAYY